jgi:lipopolysaccharide transport system permease protein
MQKFKYSAIEMAASLWRNRVLILALSQREVASRYRGSTLGLVWTFINPLLLLAVYTFVFSVVFKARWTPTSSSKTEFALVLFTGLLVFGLFSECIGRAPNLILANTNYVKKVVFPLEILPWVVMGSAIFHLGISLLVWLGFYAAFFGVPPISALLLPLVLLPLALLTMGVCWLFASLGVYLRDIAQMIGVFITCLMFLSPIFYPIAALPPDFQFVLHINPLTTAIELTRDVLVWGKTPDWSVLFRFYVVSFLIAWSGFSWFQKTRVGFADVM